MSSPPGDFQVPGGDARNARGGVVCVSGLQRARLLSATFALVGERGYEGLSARSVSERARVSNRAFYESFNDREDCFLAAFNDAVDGLELQMCGAWESELGWTARVRAALAVLLAMLDREPAVRRLVFVEALVAGPRVLARRACVLEGLAGVIDEGRVNARVPGVLPALVAEGVVGATFGVIHARLLELRPGPLLELLGSLMAMIVLPYRGSTAAARELARPVPRVAARAVRGDRVLARRGLDSASPVDYRLTVRAQLALVAVAARPGLNNREVSEVIGLADQGQISRMMKRLSEQDLIENAQAHGKRQARAWRLTRDGEAVLDAHRPLKAAQRSASKGGKLPAESARRGLLSQAERAPSPPSRLRDSTRRDTVSPAVQGSPRTLEGLRSFRMTALTYQVLVVVADLAGRGTYPSNRQIAELAGVRDEGQISKLLTRLERHGLLENSRTKSESANVWRLTPRGEEVLSASRVSKRSSQQ